MRCAGAPRKEIRVLKEPRSKRVEELTPRCSVLSCVRLGDEDTELISRSQNGSPPSIDDSVRRMAPVPKLTRQGQRNAYGKLSLYFLAIEIFRRSHELYVHDNSEVSCLLFSE